MLRISNLKVQVGECRLRDIDLHVQAGGYYVLLGPSGMGKSILLETIAGHYRPQEGRIEIGNTDITRENIQNRPVSLVYQDQNLFPHMDVARNIGYGLHSQALNRDEKNNRIREIAERTDIKHLLDRRPGTLSGGETQRVALARALVIQPQCLLLDEPLGSLDAEPRRRMQKLLREITRRRETAVLHVTHDFEEALALGSRVGIMEDGTIRREGRPETIFHNPRSEFEARMAGIRNFVRGTLRQTEEGTADFHTGNRCLSILTDDEPGRGYAIIPSTDVTLAESETHTSARNCFKGTVIDVAGARTGMEITVEAGDLSITARVTRLSVEELGIKPGKQIWVSFKASAARFVPAPTF